MAVTTFNHGEMGLAAILSALSIASSFSTLLHLTRREIVHVTKTVNWLCKRRRRQLTSQAITAESSRRRREKPGKVSRYQSGVFGTEIDSEASGEESDTICEKCRLRVCPIGRKRKADDWVACEVCLNWYHCRCMRVTNKSLCEDPYIVPDISLLVCPHFIIHSGYLNNTLRIITITERSSISVHLDETSLKSYAFRLMPHLRQDPNGHPGP